jgi:hypothetical protein
VTIRKQPAIRIGTTAKYSSSTIPQRPMAKNWINQITKPTGPQQARTTDKRFRRENPSAAAICTRYNKLAPRTVSDVAHADIPVKIEAGEISDISNNIASDEIGRNASAARETMEAAASTQTASKAAARIGISALEHSAPNRIGFQRGYSDHVLQNSTFALNVELNRQDGPPVQQVPLLKLDHPANPLAGAD